jgi:hypothetical protein
MFLNLSLKQDPGLTDFGVNYYGFLESKEYKDIEDYVMQYMPMDVYDSPYFGLGSGAYREMDRVYEAYRAKYLASFKEPKKIKSQEECPEGYLYFNESCVRGLDLRIDVLQPDPNVKRVTTTTSTISPALILAAAAAFFFAG